MKLTETKGKLFVIGGAEDKTGDCVILKEVVRFARDDKAKIVIMTAATDHPLESAKEMSEVFKRLGAKNIKSVDVSARSDKKIKKALR